MPQASARSPGCQPKPSRPIRGRFSRGLAGLISRPGLSLSLRHIAMLSLRQPGGLGCAERLQSRRSEEPDDPDRLSALPRPYGRWMSETLTKEKIEQLAPDQASLGAALKLMKPASW